MTTGNLNPGEASYRAYMRGLAIKGGATTKRRHGNDPKYYRAVGRMGGVASAAARRERCCRKVLAKAAVDGCAIAPVLVEPPTPRKTSTLDERVLALLEGENFDHDPAATEARRLFGLPEPAAPSALRRK
jgi:general stress protein YciG